ncbi:hypothetical protein ACFX2C_026821 [Malus domestica]
MDQKKESTSNSHTLPLFPAEKVRKTNLRESTEKAVSLKAYADEPYPVKLTVALPVVLPDLNEPAVLNLNLTLATG